MSKCYIKTEEDSKSTFWWIHVWIMKRLLILVILIKNCISPKPKRSISKIELSAVVSTTEQNKLQLHISTSTNKNVIYVHKHSANSYAFFLSLKPNSKFWLFNCRNLRLNKSKILLKLSGNKKNVKVIYAFNLIKYDSAYSNNFRKNNNISIYSYHLDYLTLKDTVFKSRGGKEFVDIQFPWRKN